MAEYIIDTSELSGIDEEWLAKHEQIVRCRDCDYWVCCDHSDSSGDGFCKWGEPITANGGDGEAVI